MLAYLERSFRSRLGREDAAGFPNSRLIPLQIVDECLQVTNALLEFLPISAFAIQLGPQTLHDSLHRLDGHVIRLSTSISASEEMSENRSRETAAGCDETDEHLGAQGVTSFQPAP